jgi:exodeoxyribonuclease V
MFTKINGAAGRGKTHSLIEQIKQLYNPLIQDQKFVLITPTNKAASVLNARLLAESLPKLAKTLHSTIYRWKKTDTIIGIKNERMLDPNTGKFMVDHLGLPVYQETIEYAYEKYINAELEDKIVLVDESSMVNSEVWYDLLNCDYVNEIYAYGDERQLPPIEEYDSLPDGIKPYYRFWHDSPADITLTENYRQKGTLKEFVELIETNLFDSKFKNMPTSLMIGENYSIHATEMEEQLLLQEMISADIIITPYNKVRNLCNIICRRGIAKKNGKGFNPLPVVGDKMILVDSIKREDSNTKNKYIYLAKNVYIVVDNIIDMDLNSGLMVLDFTDENGITHRGEILNISKILGKTSNSKIARIDYAYAVTAHSSQGGQWNNVLFLDSYFKNDLDKLRYVSITRASARLAIVTGITNRTEQADAESSILIRIFNRLTKGEKSL